MNRKKQLISGLLMALVPCVFLMQTGFKNDDLYLLAYIAIGIMILSGVATVIRALAIPTNAQTTDAASSDAISPKELLLITVFCLVGVLLMATIGFYVTIFVMLFGIHCYLRHRNSEISIRHSLLFAVGAWVIVYLVFGMALDLRVPSNVLLF